MNNLQTTVPLVSAPFIFTNWFSGRCKTVRAKLENNGSIRQLFLILLWLACARTALPENLYEPNEFGISQSEPVDSGFFFHEGKYIESPYVVERRGLDIYINGVLVEPGPKWALYNYKVETDPGDPPQGSYPLDRLPAGADVRDTYWFKKWGYLYSHFDHETAKKMMFETYKKSTGTTDIYWTDEKDTLCIVRRTGQKDFISLSIDGGGFAIKQPSKEDLIKRAESRRAFQENQLSSNAVICMKGGLSIVAGDQRAVDVIEILLSDADDSAKFKALQEANFLLHGKIGEMSQWVVTGFEATPQLKERFRILKEK